MRLRQRRPGFPGWLITIVNRIKRSWHGILARETLIVDRSDPHSTLKTHHVEEQQPDGTWKIVHNEKEEFEAKRRPSGPETGASDE